MVQWKPIWVVGVGDPGLAGELTVPGTLAGALSGWQRGFRGFLFKKCFHWTIRSTVVVVILTKLSCSAKREWVLTLYIYIYIFIYTHIYIYILCLLFLHGPLLLLKSEVLHMRSISKTWPKQMWRRSACAWSAGANSQARRFCRHLVRICGDPNCHLIRNNNMMPISLPRKILLLGTNESFSSS